jgi:hypothetical protein
MGVMKAMAFIDEQWAAAALNECFASSESFKRWGLVGEKKNDFPDL